MDVYIWIKAADGKSCVSPDEFLSWAKQDIRGGSRRSIANAITNAKRAIHARIDEILSAIRVQYASDWPKNATTDVKLKVLKQLKAPVTSIAKVLTIRRNDLEHSYLLPSLDQVKADVETAELWLDKSKDYFRPSVVVMGLSVKSIGITASSNRKTDKFSVTFADPRKITFFWDAKKTIATLDSSGATNYVNYGEHNWKDFVALQKNAYLSSDNKYLVPSIPIATRLFRAYEKWLLGKRGNSFSASSKFE